MSRITPDSGVRRRLVVSKQDLLLFEHIVVLGLERQIEQAAQHDPQTAAEAQYLAENGVLLGAPETPYDLGSSSHVDINALGLAETEHLPASIRNLLVLASTARHPSSLMGGEPFPADGELVVSWVLNVLGASTIPLLEVRPRQADWDQLRNSLQMPPEMDDQSSDQALVEVVLSHLPVPGDDVPFEDVVNFTQDAETIRRRDSLLLALARSQLEMKGAKEFSLDLAEAIHEYKAHMRIADMRTRTSALQVVVGASLGAVEELIHLRPRRAFDALFEYRKLKADRLEAELSSPGSQFSYIYHVERKFG